MSGIVHNYSDGGSMITEGLVIKNVSDEALRELWENAGRNLSAERLVVLQGENPNPRGTAEEHFLSVLEEMRARTIASS